MCSLYWWYTATNSGFNLCAAPRLLCICSINGSNLNKCELYHASIFHFLCRLKLFKYYSLSALHCCASPLFRPNGSFINSYCQGIFNILSLPEISSTSDIITMPSLKRQRSNDNPCLEYGLLSKRPLHRRSYEGVPASLITEPQAAATLAPQPVNGSTCCMHKINGQCGLSMAKCCACADKRPELTRYSIYRDGEGFVSGGARWTYYCMSCKGITSTI
jgi:hypothetical protein